MIRSLPFAAAVLASFILLRATGAEWFRFGPALGLSLAWVAGCFAFAWRRRPGPYGALAFWDRQAGRRDAFANAWWFEQLPARDAGQDFHLCAQLQELPAAVSALRSDVALPDLRRLLLAPMLLLALALIPGGGESHPPDVALAEEGRRLAEREGQKLAEKRLDAEGMKALTEDEKKELEEMQRKVAETAKSLGKKQAETVRQVLSELDRRARDAEKLAQKLAAGSDAWASEQMIAEMRKHADTAELGDAVADKSTNNTANEAEKLAGRLRDERLPGETRDRLTESLREIGRQSQPGDKERTVGQHVIAADKSLAQALPKDAGMEFQKLADKMRSLAAREKARDQLEKLAQQLRDSGSKIAGQGGQGMRQLADGQGREGNSGPQQQMTTLPNPQGMQGAQMPGMSGASQGQGAGQSSQMLQPSKGDGKDAKGFALAPPGAKPGEKPDGGSERPMLFAPVPGMPPDQRPDAVLLMPGSSLGGAPPGTGTAKLGNEPSKPAKAGRDGVVNAQRGAEGDSAVRAVEGGTHAERATRSAEAAALEAIRAEENALDDAALPAARRDQVRRYFTELRRRFEKEN